MPRSRWSSSRPSRATRPRWARRVGEAQRRCRWWRVWAAVHFDRAGSAPGAALRSAPAWAPPAAAERSRRSPPRHHLDSSSDRSSWAPNGASEPHGACCERPRPIQNIARETLMFSAWNLRQENCTHWVRVGNKNLHLLVEIEYTRYSFATST